MLKMLKKKTIWSQKKVTRIKKREREIGEEELRHAPSNFCWLLLSTVYLLV